MTTTVVVTGAGSGMGRACIEQVRALGDVIIAVDLRAPEIEGTTGIACDVADSAAVSALADQLGEIGGSVP